MRKLGGTGVLDVLSPDVFSVLQLCSITEPLFPGIKTLDLSPAKESISFIPLFLSPRTIAIRIWFPPPDFPEVPVASMITNLPSLCPNLQDICLYGLPEGPVITTAISTMLLATDRNTLRCFCVDYPLSQEAREVVYTLPNLRTLLVVIGRGTSLPPVILPNLADLTIAYNQDSDWLRAFHGATLGRLEAVTLTSDSENIKDPLEAFERVALTASAQHTLSELNIFTSCSWSPNYHSLHRFTQMKDLAIEFSCDDGCSSTVDDDVIMNLARAMPKLETLELGGPPCRTIVTGVTVKGFMVLAHHCPNLLILRVHFQVASLSTLPTISGTTPDVGSVALPGGCALRSLEVGQIPIPEESVLVVALTLVHIFPRITSIDCDDENWDEVVGAICLSRGIINCSSKELLSLYLEVTFMTPP